MFDRDSNGRIVIYGIGDRIVTPSGLKGTIAKITKRAIYVRVEGLRKLITVRVIDCEFVEKPTKTETE